MRTILLLICGGSAAYGLTVFGLVLNEFTGLMLGLTLVSLIFFLHGIVRQKQRAAGAHRPWVVIDGSNVMHWRDQVPQIDVVRGVVHELTQRGYRPGVVFDANAGYKLSGRYQGDAELGRLVGLPSDRVFVVPKGKQADPFLLDAARDLKARIVTNDRFRDWAVSHPEVHTPGHLIRGGYRDGALWLDDKMPVPA